MRVEYRCLDGSPFPVEFADGADAERRWLVDLEHAPSAMAPLAEVVNREGRRGEERAYSECGLTVPSTMRCEPPRANGFQYFCEFELPPREADELASRLAGLAKAHGWTAGFWNDFCVPRLRHECELLDAADVDTTFRELSERRSYVWSLTGIAGIMARRDERAVAESSMERFGERAAFIAHQLAQGNDNQTIAADRALSRLASLDPASAEASSAREEFLETYGGCTSGWPIDHPTLREQPGALDAQLRMLRAHPSADLAAVADGAVARRQQLVAEIASSLSDEDGERFERRVARLSSFVAVREARAHWQLLASGAMRGRVRERGRHLLERGVLTEIDEVFFLTPAEYDESTGDLRVAVAERRAEYQHWLTVTPPPVIGGPALPADRDLAAPQDALLVRGAAGSPGTATGSARLIGDLAEADRLVPGDILVTTMTSPPWTPLFGVAAAVVTDAGDALSHVAIAAREYGIPCVVGTHHATVSIPDGSTITVDGDAGTVRLERV